MIITASIAWSDIIHVPDDYPTIKAGIVAAAVIGDTVLVADGVYTGDDNKNLDFRGKAITVTSENGAENCIIDCEGDGRGFYFHNGEDTSAMVSGFTVRNGCPTGKGGGILCESSSPTITHNIIINNTGTSVGGGIYCNGSSAIITDNIITENTVAGRGHGGGFGCHSSSGVVLANNIITKNSTDYVGGGIYIHSSSLQITNNIIAENSTSIGGGIFCDPKPSPTITNNTIVGNSATDNGSGIACHAGGSPVVINTILWNDGPDEIYLYGGSDSITVTYSDIKGGWEGEGNINADPLFIDPDNGNYHLQAGSPCIDAGDPNSPKDPDGTRADIGAFYYDQSGVSVPTTLEKVSGDNQSGDVGSVLPYPLVVLLLDQYSELMEGVTVNFSPSEGASVNPTQATTDENGLAQTILTLGTLPGEYTVTVSVEGIEPVIFTATAIESGRPIILSVYPNYGYTIGGTEITITGTKFQDGATVTIGGKPAVDVTNLVEVPASIKSETINITDEAPEDVQLEITLDEGAGATTEMITFSTSGISLRAFQAETTSQIDILRIIIQTAINNTFGQDNINVAVTGLDTSAIVTFTTIAIGTSVSLTIEQLAGSDVLFSEPITSIGGEAILVTTPAGTLGPKDVTVVNPDGNEDILHNGFFYIPIAGDVSGDGTVSAYDAALILQFVVGIIDSFPVDSPIGQAAQKFVAGEITIEELDRILQKWGYPSVFKLLVIENQLLQNFPNPFNPETWIPFKLAQDTPVTINIYDTRGQLIRTIELGNKNAGVYTTKDKAAYWDGRDSLGEKVASGIYYYTLQAGEFRATRKMVIMK